MAMRLFKLVIEAPTTNSAQSVSPIAWAVHLESHSSKEI